MKNLLRCFTVMLITSAAIAYAQPPKLTPEEALLLNNGSMGKEFYIAIPPNEKADHPSNGIEIYVTSNNNTSVTIEAPKFGYYKTKPVTAFKITTFGAQDGIGNNFEVRTSEEISEKGIHITSPDPISVYVLNAKPVTSEGFMALPVDVWGTENMHCGYYDFGEIKPWGGGFIILASEDSTEVNISLKGRGFGRTVGGRKIGNTWSVQLQKGDVYSVKGNGATLGTFDITGTSIKSDKPVGLISFHERTMIPAIGNNNGRDHLSEMIPPVSSWGKSFVTGEYQRRNKGDLFRLLAKENNTIFVVKWYDKQTGEMLGQVTDTLETAGEWWEFNESETSPGEPSIRGFAVWEADKPVLLMQYSYSAQWDGASQFDPFMIVVPPLEQYIQSAVLQTPANVAFNTNWLNIIAVGDSTDTTHTLLKTIKLDDKYVFKTHPDFLVRRIRTTNLHYVSINVPPGAHRIESETKFSAYIYGFSDFDSYGYLAGMAFNKNDETDSLAPEIEISSGKGSYTITVSEDVQTNTQKDQGLSKVVLLPKRSSNIELEIAPFKAGVKSLSFILKVQDPTKDAKGVFGVADRSGNISLDSVEYQGIPNSITESAESASQLKNISPNPASGNRVTLSYKVGEAGAVRLDIISAQGEIVKTPVNQNMQPGIYAAIVDIADLASGVYHCRITTGKSFTQIKSFVITK